jgi:membrane fusion protein (multidrug efflux system)
MKFIKNSNERIKSIVVLTFLLCVFLVGVCSCRQQVSPLPPVPEVATVTVRTQQVVLTTELPGRTSAYLVAEVRPQVSGIIQKRLFTEGGDVKAGDLLYQIDPALYQASYDNAKAMLARAEANVSPVRLRAERYKELVDVKAVSQQDYDDAAAALKQAQAEVDVNKAAVEAARINLAYTRITAPISGRIGKSNITVGALATAHQTLALATIQQLDPIYVDATQSSVTLLRLKRNMAAGRVKNADSGQARVNLLLEDGTPYAPEGTLKFSDVTVDPSTGSIILRMVFSNQEHTLLPGMFVRAVVEEGVAPNAILISQQGVSRNPKGEPIALIVDAAGKVGQRMLTLDRAIGDQWLISTGLAPGDQVIVEGVQQVRPGAAVKVVSFHEGETSGAALKKTAQPSPKSN